MKNPESFTPLTEHLAGTAANPAPRHGTGAFPSPLPCPWSRSDHVIQEVPCFPVADEVMHLAGGSSRARAYLTSLRDQVTSSDCVCGEEIKGLLGNGVAPLISLHCGSRLIARPTHASLRQKSLRSYALVIRPGRRQQGKLRCTVR